MIRLVLCRHGESTGNRDHLWAGITDNELTTHGYLQAQRLGAYLAKLCVDSDICSIYCSDLVRAKRTAVEIGLASGKECTVTELLREQDLGWREGRSYKDGDRSDVNNAQAMQANPGETKADMDIRAATFIEQHLQRHLRRQSTAILPDADLPPALGVLPANKTIIIVSHGLFLLRLYYSLVSYLKIALPHSPSWSNTGCTHLCVASDDRATVTDVNSVEHLQGLKRTRAGVGSAEYDPKQKKVSDYFQRKRCKGIQAREVQEKGLDAADQTRASGPLRPPSTEELELQASIAAIDAACQQAATLPA